MGAHTKKERRLCVCVCVRMWDIVDRIALFCEGEQDLG